MDEFSLNNVNIELFRLQKNSNYSSLKNLTKFQKDEIREAFLIFLYDLTIDVIAKGNKIIYINSEVIYYNKEKNLFKYHSKNYVILEANLSKVSFDSQNIIYVHPDYLQQKDDMSLIENLRLKYILWSISMLILKFVFSVMDYDLISLHKNQTNLATIYKSYKIPDKYLVFLKFCFSYEESIFSDFYKM
jgi:hypothetical protein